MQVLYAYQMQGKAGWLIDDSYSSRGPRSHGMAGGGEDTHIPVVWDKYACVYEWEP